MAVLLEYKIVQHLSITFDGNGEIVFWFKYRDDMGFNEIITLKKQFYKYSKQELLELVKKYAPEKLI